MRKLYEEDTDTNDIFIYVDTETGNSYYFNGKQLVLFSKKPQIGDHGNQDIQDVEEEERKKQIEDEGGEVESEEAKKQRISKIKGKFSDSNTADEVKNETAYAKEKDNARKQRKAQEKKNADPLRRFKLSLTDFIKNSVAEQRDSTWSKFNKKYSGSGIMRPGTSKHKTGKVPLINVYFDRSASWDAEKTAVADATIASLDKYVKKKLINIKKYYFDTEVSDVDFSGGGTDGEPVMQHILKTTPDNVIIMTDADFDWRDSLTPVTVPGGVWMLFKGGVSNVLMKALKGKKLTKMFDLADSN